MDEAKRIFTLREAQALLPEVRRLTSAAVAGAESLGRRIESLDPGPDRGRLEAEFKDLVRDWAAAVSALGVEVKGLWLVDFDSGDGLYYCWQHPESDIEYFHDYDAGFAGRKPLGPLRSS